MNLLMLKSDAFVCIVTQYSISVQVAKRKRERHISHGWSGVPLTRRMRGTPLYPWEICLSLLRFATCTLILYCVTMQTNASDCIELWSYDCEYHS